MSFTSPYLTNWFLRFLRSDTASAARVHKSLSGKRIAFLTAGSPRLERWPIFRLFVVWNQYHFRFLQPTRIIDVQQCKPPLPRSYPPDDTTRPGSPGTHHGVGSFRTKGPRFCPCPKLRSVSVRRRTKKPPYQEIWHGDFSVLSDFKVAHDRTATTA